MDAASPGLSGLHTIAVIGVGLIGGSIAAAVQRRAPTTRVIGIGRDRAKLEPARRAGLLDQVGTEVSAAGEAELVIVCTPVDHIAADVRGVAGHLRAGAVVTDAGSAKGSICRELQAGLPDGVAFVGSHPLAGSEKSGWRHADAELFADRVCVMTPDDSAAPAAVARVAGFWQALGMRVVRMTPDDHDHALALTSHLPHVAAAALASLLDRDERSLAATGFRDTTRVAAGDPDLWAAILLANAASLSARIDLYCERLAEFRAAIDDQDAPRLQALLQLAKEQRDRLT